MTSLTPVQEYDAILATLKNYADGARSGKSSDIKLAFHDQATIFGYVGPDLFAGAIQGFYEWHDSNGAAADLQLRIASVEVAGTVATVRIEIDNWTGHQFTDFMTLLKVDGEWKIMNKVFHLHG